MLVTEIIASQRLPTGKRFRVLVEGRGVFELEYDEIEDLWLVQPR